MRANFFDAIALTDRERVHSSILSWVFSKDNDLFNIDQKSIIIKSLCSLPEEICFNNIDSITEFDSIDILIELELDDNQRMYVYIENKFKSSQGRNQLMEYSKTINKRHSLERFEKLYLTFIDEEAKDEGWKNISYDRLFSILATVFKTVSQSNVTYYIFKEYLASLSELLRVKNDFLENYFKDEYEIVFTDGSKKKSVKVRGNYIADNQLETTLQKCFLNKLRKALILQDCEYNLSETRGNADLSIVFDGFKAVGHNEVDFDFAFQNGTFKLAVSKDYWSNKNIKKNKDIIAQWDRPMRQIKGVTFNSRRSKPRISITWKFPLDNLDVDMWYKTDFENMICVFNNEINRAKKYQREIISNYYQNG